MTFLKNCSLYTMWTLVRIILSSKCHCQKGKLVRCEINQPQTYVNRMVFFLPCRWWRYFGSCMQLKGLTWSSDLSCTRNHWGGRVVQKESINRKALNSPWTPSRKTLPKLWCDRSCKKEKIALVVWMHGKLATWCPICYVLSLISWQM